MRDNQGNTPLHKAIGRSDNHNLAAIILINNDPQTILFVNDAKQSPLSIAIDTSSTYNAISSYIGWFIIKEHPFSLDYRGPSDLTLLHCAVIRQDYVFVVEIVKANRELINEVDEHGRNPLHYAAILGNAAIARRLLEADASSSLGYKADRKGQTPLHLAAENGQKVVFAMFANCYPNAIVVFDGRQRSILHLAAQNGYVSVVKFILTFTEMEYLLNSPDVDGHTPLHLAAMNFHKEVVHVLSKIKKVNIRATNHSQQTALAIVESSTDPKRDIQKQYLTVMILKEAITARAFYPEDILQYEMRFCDMERDVRQIRDRKTAQTLLVMATLIVTFTFTAVFTLPGGYEDEGPNKGRAKLDGTLGLAVFVISITIAMISSMTAAALILIQILYGNNQLYMDVNLISQAVHLIWIGLALMSLAFLTGLFMVLPNLRASYIVVICLGWAFPFLLFVLRPFLGVRTFKITSKYSCFWLVVIPLLSLSPLTLFAALLVYYLLLGQHRFKSVERFYLRLHWYDKKLKLFLDYGLYRHTTLSLFLIIPIVLAKIVLYIFVK